MSLFKLIFGGSKKVIKDRKGIEEYLDFIDSLKSPAVVLSESDKTANSRIGGLPSLPDNFSWPQWNGKPLSFLCQIDLSELPDTCIRQLLPTNGMLFFFYNQEQETWGFDPNDKGSWQVLYSTTQNKSTHAAPIGMDTELVFKEKTITLSHVETYPNWQDDRVWNLNLNEHQSDQYTELCSGVFDDGPKHQLFGYPSPLQGNNMDLECQLASHGIYCGDISWQKNTRIKKLEAGKNDWILLLQLDTDDDTGMMWGDCGRLYFWIRKADLAELNFEKCWMILQC